MSINDTLDTLIAEKAGRLQILDNLIAQLQHITITSSDDELYDAPTLDDATGIWTLAQSTANVGGLYVGCYTLPDNAINSFITNVNVITYNAPSSPTAPATVTESGESPVDLTDVLDLEGQSFNSFCIRSTSAFEIEVRIADRNCDVSTWTVYLGTLIDSGVNYVTFQSQNIAGQYGNYRVSFGSNNKDICCCGVTATFLGGTPSAPVEKYIPCGTEIVGEGSFTHAAPGSAAISTIAVDAASAFTVRFDFTDICP